MRDVGAFAAGFLTGAVLVTATVRIVVRVLIREWRPRSEK